MNAPEFFTKEQQAYLQGLVLGTDVARTIKQLPVLSGSLGTKELVETVLQVGGNREPAPEHLSSLHSEAQKRFERAGRNLVVEEKAKRDKSGLGMWEEIGQRSIAGEFPKGTDVFLTKFYGLFYVAPAQDSFMCRMRLPGGVLRAEQLRGLADLSDDCAGSYVDITTRANLQLREIPANRAMDVLTGLRDLGNQAKDVEIRKGLARRFRNSLDCSNSAFAVDEGPFFFSPTCCWKNQVGVLRRFCGRVHVLNDEQIQLLEKPFRSHRICPRMGGVSSDHPKGFHLSCVDTIHDLVIGPARVGRNDCFRYLQQAGDLFAMFRIREIVVSDQTARIAEESRAHRIALAGDTVSPRARSTDVSSH